MRFLLLALAAFLSACTLTLYPEGLSVTYRVDFGGAILRFEPDRGRGATYFVGEGALLPHLGPPGLGEPGGAGSGRLHLRAGPLPPFSGHPRPASWALPLHPYPASRPPPGAGGLHPKPPSGRVRLEGRYTDWDARLRLYVEASGARAYDVAETYFYVR